MKEEKGHIYAKFDSTQLQTTTTMPWSIITYSLSFPVPQTTRRNTKPGLLRRLTTIAALVGRCVYARRDSESVCRWLDGVCILCKRFA